jgi:hypothetical protein
MTREVIHLVGDFKPSVLERWTLWAQIANYELRHTTMEELGDKIYGKTNPIIIFDDLGLNDLHLPGTPP